MKDYKKLGGKNHLKITLYVLEIKCAEIEKLEAAGLINHRRLRDIFIHQRYRSAREDGLTREESLAIVKTEYPKDVISMGETRLTQICCSKINVKIIND